MSDQNRTQLTFDKPLMVVTAAYPPRSSGTAVIMYNLLRVFSSQHIVLLTKNHSRKTGSMVVGDGHQPSYFSHQVSFSHRLNLRWQRLQALVVPHLIARRALRTGCGAILGVFPDLMTIDIARRGAARARLPLVAYLHDTIVESFSEGKQRSMARRVQARLFKKATSIVVVNEGMAHLYKDRYGIVTPVIPHAFWDIDTATAATGEIENTIFFGGNVYGINYRSMGRVAEAVRGIPGTRLVVASSKTRESVEKYGLKGESVELTFFGDRAEYIEALGRQGMLLVAINWPDESSVVGPDELATIFSTKIVEYLISGRPILAHCPEDYFVAKFIREKRCGVVVSERSPDRLRDEISGLLADESRVRELAMNARRALEYFDGGRVSGLFQREIQAILRRAKPEVSHGYR